LISQKRRKAAYRNCFGGDAGRIVLHDLYKFCNAMEPVASGDSHRTFFEEGKRNVFLHIFHLMKFEDERKKLKELEETRDE
jgi:hypothetical protein